MLLIYSFKFRFPFLDKIAIQRIQALADISRSVLYAFAVYKAISLRTCVVIATKPVHRLQIRQCTIRGHHYHSPKLHPGLYSSVGMQRGTD